MPPLERLTVTSTHAPNLTHLRKQAKALQRAWQNGDSDAQERVAGLFPDITRLGLQNAQFVIAREYGFRSWTALVSYAPQLGHFDDIATFRVSRDFPVPSERLWNALSRPDQIKSWLLPVTFEQATGAPYSFHSNPAMTGTIGEFDEQQAIRFDSDKDKGAFWRFAIEPLGQDTSQVRMTIVDRMTTKSVEQFPGGASKLWNPGVTAGWHEILDALEQHLTGRQPPVIDYPRLCRFYDRILEQLHDATSDRQRSS